jgi:ADP-L-glycero-D-manno-heptose 6-epimerase
VIVVTGAAGFIGSCIVAKLNEEGKEDLILVDHLEGEADPKNKNIETKKYAQYFQKDAFIDLIEKNQLEQSIECIIHMGACSSTTLQDEEYFRINNLEYTQKLALWAMDHGVRFIYASSAATYGDGSVGYRDDDNTVKKCRPLNLYGESKQKFDIWALENNYLDKIVGLKFFNVFGPNEYHKDDMRSVVNKAYKKVVTEGKMVLFKSYKQEYADGEQKRDFIYVKDAVDVVMYFLKNENINGIFNVGTGKANAWNDLAHALFLASEKTPDIEYVEMPEILKDKYQYFTEANMTKLAQSGCDKKFMSLEDSVKDYVGYLKNKSYM